MQLDRPEKVYIETTNICNLRCSLCFQSENNGMLRKKGMMDLELYKYIINEVRSLGSKIALHLAGEPFLHPRLFEFIRYARKNGVNTKVSTNGLFLDTNNFEILDTDLSELEISFMGVSKQDYIDVRHYDGFNKLLGLVDVIGSEKSKRAPAMDLIVSGIMTKQNQAQCVDFYDKVSNIHGVDKVLLKSVWNWTGSINVLKKRLVDYNRTDTLKLIFDNKEKAYKKQIENLNENYLACVNPFVSIAICWDGVVVPCCMDIDKRYPLGNIRDKSLIDIWNGSEMNEIRGALRSMAKVSKHPLCGVCKG